MQDSRVVTDLSRGVTACAIGVAVGIGLPAILPGVAVMCVIILTMEFI